MVHCIYNFDHWDDDRIHEECQDLNEKSKQGMEHLRAALIVAGILTIHKYPDRWNLRGEFDAAMHAMSVRGSDELWFDFGMQSWLLRAV